MKTTPKKTKKPLDCLIKRVYIGRVKNSRNSEFAALRSRYERELAEVENKARILRAKLNNLAEAERDANAPANAELPQEYSELGLTEAILKSISELIYEPQYRDLGISVAAIKQRMLTHGFFPTGSKFDIAVSVTLKRLRDSKRVNATSLNGEYFYRPLKK